MGASSSQREPDLSADGPQFEDKNSWRPQREEAPSPPQTGTGSEQRQAGRSIHRPKKLKHSHLEPDSLGSPHDPIKEALTQTKEGLVSMENSTKKTKSRPVKKYQGDNNQKDVFNYRSKVLEEKNSSELEQNRALKTLIPVLKAIRRFHQHEIVGLERIPRQGKVLLAVNHSLATYDIFLLLQAIFEDVGRLPRPLADRLFFKIPFLGDLIRYYGAVQGSPDTAKRLLSQGELVTVAPGGMREALRPSNQKYQVMWGKRKGFAKLAVETGAPVVLAACPHADDLYDIYPSHVTAWFYKTYKIPIFFATGWKKTALPHPVKLVHFISEPLLPPKLPKSPRAIEKAVESFHEELESAMADLMLMK